jgi:tetratricopeptide (TPR) repeat protein
MEDAMRSLAASTGLFVYFFCTLLAPTTAVASERAIYEDAVAALDGGDYGVAAERFQALIDQRPDWAAGHVALGRCHYLLGNPERGEAIIRTAREVDPETDLFRAYLEPGRDLYERKRYEEAIAPLEAALEHAPESHARSVSLQLAYAYYLAGRHDEARRALDEHQQSYGEAAQPSYYVALSCQRLGDYPCALDNLRRTVQLAGGAEPGRKALRKLAKWSRYWALAPENRDRRDALLDQAVQDTGDWHRAEPRNAVALEYYAETLLAARRSERVVRELTPVARNDAANCVAQRALAGAWNAIGNGNEAMTWARKAKSCDPAAPQAHVELAVACILQLRPEHSSLEEVRRDRQLAREAMESLDAALKLGASDDEPRARALRADVEETLEKLGHAEAAFVARDDAYRDALLQARADEVRERCLSVSWKLRDESRELTSEEQAFYREHDCKRYARQSAPGAERAAGP